MCLGGSLRAEPVTLRSLLHEMTDLRSLAEFPAPAFTCRQFSSYDRASTSPGDGKSWFANGDAGHFLRQEQRDGRTEYVLMDATGPGAIVRIWSANPAGTLRIYLDEQAEPVLAVPMTDLLGGRVEGVPEPIAGQRSRGWNCYLPIPYARHCKVTSDEGGFYYHVNYRTYVKGTRVESVQRADLRRFAEEIERVAGVLGSPRNNAAAAERWTTLWTAKGAASDDSRLAGSMRLDAPSPEGGAIAGLRVRVESAAPADILRKTVLRIRFDGSETVACPLGDFFGAGPGLNPYASLPMGITQDGTFWSHWFMPFRRSTETSLEYQGRTEPPAAIDSVRVAVERYDWSERSMYFHARWRREAEIPTRPRRDWNYAAIQGQGVFVGAALAIANPVRAWWGEGDEKIYVDGETFPSFFGTGTEDYFGYAWCCNVPFGHAYHNQPRCDGPGNYGWTSVNRWHILDRIPFRESFRFDMELWHWDEEASVTQSVVAYWYARPGANDEFEPIQADNLRVVEMPPYVPPRVAGALEGEQMRVIESVGTVAPQDIGGCSNDQHMWWRPGGQDARTTPPGPGARLTLGFDVEKAGRYRVLARFLKAADYGISQLSINGEPAGGPIDLYHDGIHVSDEVDLGVLDLRRGENRLTVRVVGANEKAIKKYMFGLDYLRFEPPEEGHDLEPRQNE